MRQPPQLVGTRHGVQRPNLVCRGAALAQFFSSNKGGSLPSSWPFDGCDVPRASDATIKALGPAAGYVAAEPSAFFVIPLGAHTPIPTVGFCNKPTSP